MSRTPSYRPPRRRSERNRAVVIGSMLVVVAAAILMWLVVNYASEQPDKVNLPGGDTFIVGDAERFAERIDSQREPILFKDPLSSRAGREIYVVHVGDDAKEGWSAVEAYAPNAPREIRCILRWDRDDEVFTDPCATDGDDASYEADDPRLRRYTATVNKETDNVEVDLRS